MILRETKTLEEALAVGRHPNFMEDSILWSERIVEIEPVGDSVGIIKWEWSIWDHIVQFYDSTLSNYNLIFVKPELMNINYFSDETKDWLHMNSIDYNESLDQIIVSCPEIGEFWIIDHSTTTEEAASHEGGNRGKGGDILYRWGNRAAHLNGGPEFQKFYFQHNVHWIEEELLMKVK